eukprot:gnl/TRDRNA2_/TRDRNA2_132409_c0_seq1.p2 gnl/TRDRNA2_/TRDRNA2_132409_c0~~gnl/TRDRNA2_/TRDRNA2_132409_c0_seq1.p2  ORF type:complete len:179 (+),score=44.72 gnl/TRDRNA2_/TRDRNA2_132409_c0_seq1:683-1219(+)
MNSYRAEPKVREYKVAAAGMLVKRKTNDDQKMIQIKKAKGSSVYTTGMEFIGPSGGMWVELSTKNEQKPGWVLVHGKTIGMDQPLLEPVVEKNRAPDPDDRFWGMPCSVQVHCSDLDKIAPIKDESGRLAPMEDWAKFTEKNVDVVTYEGLLHDQLLESQDVFRKVCHDLIGLMRLRK